VDVVLVPLEGVLRVRLHVGELEGARPVHIRRRRPVLAVLLDRLGVCDPVGPHAGERGEVAGGVGEADLDGSLVDGADARSRLGLAFVDIGRAFDRAEEEDVAAADVRAEGAVQRGDDVLRGDGAAVVEGRFAQRERVRLAVVGDLPLLRERGNGLEALLVDRGQPVEDVLGQLDRAVVAEGGGIEGIRCFCLGDPERSRRARALGGCVAVRAGGLPGCGGCVARVVVAAAACGQCQRQQRCDEKEEEQSVPFRSVDVHRGSFRRAAVGRPPALGRGWLGRGAVVRPSPGGLGRDGSAVLGGRRSTAFAGARTLSIPASAR
jgi:hypothetical protein